MCYIHDQSANTVAQKELSTEEWKSIAQQAHKAGSLFLLFTGGEPLLRPDFPELYLYCKKLGFEININSNGSLITDELIDMFKRFPPVKICITLYGANENSYTDVTRTVGNFQRVTTNIEKLRAAGINVKLNLTASNYNSCDIESIFAFADSHSLPIQAACYLFPSARLGHETDRPSPLEAAKNMITADRCYYKDKYQKKLEAIRNVDFSAKPPVPREAEPIKCRGGRSSCWISYDGKMTPCGMMPIPVADVRNSDFLSAWNTILEAIKPIRLPQKCANCAYRTVCDVCAASCFAETGDYGTASDYMCEKAHHFINLMKEELT